MACVLTPTRRVALILASLFSVTLGLALVFVLVTPDRISQIRTPELLGVLALLLLPGVSVWSLRRSRRANVAAVFAHRAQRLATSTPVATAPAIPQPLRQPAPRSAPNFIPRPGATNAPEENWQIVIPVQGLMKSARRAAVSTQHVSRAVNDPSRSRAPVAQTASRERKSSVLPATAVAAQNGTHPSDTTPRAKAGPLRAAS